MSPFRFPPSLRRPCGADGARGARGCKGGSGKMPSGAAEREFSAPCRRRFRARPCASKGKGRRRETGRWRRWRIGGAGRRARACAERAFGPRRTAGGPFRTRRSVRPPCGFSGPLLRSGAEEGAVQGARAQPARARRRSGRIPSPAARKPARRRKGGASSRSDRREPWGLTRSSGASRRAGFPSLPSPWSFCQIDRHFLEGSEGYRVKEGADEEWTRWKIGIIRRLLAASRDTGNPIQWC